MNAVTQSRLLTTQQAATYLGVHRSTVRRLVIEGSLPHLDSFKSWRVEPRRPRCVHQSRKGRAVMCPIPRSSNRTRQGKVRSLLAFLLSDDGTK